MRMTPLKLFLKIVRVILVVLAVTLNGLLLALLVLLGAHRFSWHGESSGTDPLALIAAVVPLTNLVVLIWQGAVRERRRTLVLVLLVADVLLILGAAANVYLRGYAWRIPALLMVPVFLSVAALSALSIDRADSPFQRGAETTPVEPILNR
jgi:hypothetical protein